MKLLGTLLRVLAVVWIVLAVIAVIAVPAEAGIFVVKLVAGLGAFSLGSWLKKRGAAED